MDKRNGNQDVKAAALDIARDFNRMVPDAMAVTQFQTMFQKYVDLLAYLEKCGELDADNLRGARVAMARHGMLLAQKILPALSTLADDLLQSAGAEAVRTVCRPMIFRGANNEIVREAASGFEVPEKYQESTIGAHIAKAAKSTAAAVTAVTAVISAAVFGR